MQQDTNLIRQTASQDEEGIGLIDVFHFIQNGWRTIASTGAFGLLIGCAYAFLAPQKFQAELLMQGALVAGQPVEAAATLVEKLKQLGCNRFGRHFVKVSYPTGVFKWSLPEGSSARNLR